jgi:octaprenyl-diphosphate synthase
MLFSTCTKSGAISVNASDENIEKLRLFGELYGICFQIKDDIFDYISSKKEIGKPVGNDIREGKITLPLLYALKNSEDADEYIKILKDKDFSKKNIERIIDFSIKNKGIEYAEKRMNDFKNEAIKTLDTFEDSDIKKSLIMTLEHTIQRKK